MLGKLYFYQLWILKIESNNANRRGVNKDKILKFHIRSRNSTMYNNVYKKLPK